MKEDEDTVNLIMAKKLIAISNGNLKNVIKIMSEWLENSLHREPEIKKRNGKIRDDSKRIN